MRLATFVLAALSYLPSQACADPVALEEYITDLDRTEVTFEGYIRYDKSEDRYSFYNLQRENFPAVFDAGRSAREKVQETCEENGFLIYVENLCSITGAGSIEIRGSQVWISIEEVTSLEAPE